MPFNNFAFSFPITYIYQLWFARTAKNKHVLAKHDTGSAFEIEPCSQGSSDYLLTF
jgi:hypothetical protein